MQVHRSGPGAGARRRHAWMDAGDELAAADAVSPLGTEDLERLPEAILPCPRDPRRHALSAIWFRLWNRSRKGR